MAETNLDIKIRTTADTTGATAAAASLKGVESASKGAATSAQAQSKATNELGENFEKGAAAGRVLSEVSRGNVLALGQLGAALKTIGVLLKTNLIGALFTLGAVAAQVILPMVAGFMNKKKAVEEATSAVEQATKAVKDLGEQRLETLQGALALIDETAKRTLEDLNDALDSAEKLADAQDRLAIARIEADPNLSDSAKISARAGIADSAAARRSAAAISLAEGVVGARRNAAQGASSVETSAAGRFNEASGRVESAASYRRNLEGQVPGLRGEMASAAQGELGFNEPAYLVAAGKMDELTAKIALLNVPEGQAREASLKTDLLAATTALNDANKASLKSAEDLAESERKLAKVRADQAAVAPVEKKIREIDTGAQLTTAKAKEAAAAQEAVKAVPERVLTETAGRVQNPGDLNAAQEKQVVQRALEINRNAAAQAGTQAGETIGEAFGMALKELFPEVTNAILINVRSQINEAVKAESARINARLDQSDARARNERR